MSEKHTPPHTSTKKPAETPPDAGRIDRVTRIFCAIVDGVNFDGAIAKAMDIEANIVTQCS